MLLAVALSTIVVPLSYYICEGAVSYGPYRATLTSTASLQLTWNWLAEEVSDMSGVIIMDIEADKVCSWFSIGFSDGTSKDIVVVLTDQSDASTTTSVVSLKSFSVLSNNGKLQETSGSNYILVKSSRLNDVGTTVTIKRAGFTGDDKSAVITKTAHLDLLSACGTSRTWEAIFQEYFSVYNQTAFSVIPNKDTIGDFFNKTTYDKMLSWLQNLRVSLKMSEQSALIVIISTCTLVTLSLVACVVCCIRISRNRRRSKPVRYRVENDVVDDGSSETFLKETF